MNDIINSESITEKEDELQKEVQKQESNRSKIKSLSSNKLNTIKNRRRDGRIPLHKQKRIGIDKEKGFKYRLVNDEGDRLSNFCDAGYEFVEDIAKGGAKDASDSSQLGKYASQKVGGGITAYYMRVPEEFWEEDQKDKQKYNDEVMSRIGLGSLDQVPESKKRGDVEITDSFSSKK